ncbi:MAG: hypothetical protein NVSMB18_13900 [Acetobacteraceae bacterium]
MELRKPELQEAGLMSATDQNPNGPAIGASRVGAELRAARLRLGWALPEVSQELRIRLPFLEAIEDGRVADLPGNAYAVGFLRTYATSLGLDAAEVARRFRAEAHEVNRKTELSFPAPVPERGVPAGAVVLLGVLLAVGAYAAWYRFSDDHRAEVGVAAVPDRLAPLAERPTPPSTNVSPQVASVLPPPAGSPASSPVPAAPNAGPAPVSVPVPVPVPVTPPAPLQTAAAPAAPKDANRVVLKFKADAYVQVRERQGQVLLNRVMRAGDSWPVPNGTGLLLTTGNAGGTELVVDGTTAAPLGGNGVVKRDLPLEPEAIKMPPGTRPAAATRPQ